MIQFVTLKRNFRNKLEQNYKPLRRDGICSKSEMVLMSQRDDNERRVNEFG